MYQQTFLARIQHLDRTLCFLGEQGDVNLPGDVFFAAKPSAHQRCYDAYRFRFYAQRRGDLVTIAVRNLAADVNRGLVMRGGFATCCLWIERSAKILRVVTGGHADRAFGFKKQVFSRGRSVGPVDDRIGCRESSFDIAFVHFDVFEQVALGPAFVDQW